MRHTSDFVELREVLATNPQMKYALENIPGGESVGWDDLAIEVSQSFGLRFDGMAIKISRFFFHYLTKEPLHAALGLERIGTVGARWDMPIKFRKEVCR